MEPLPMPIIQIATVLEVIQMAVKEMKLDAHVINNILKTAH